MNSQTNTGLLKEYIKTLIATEVEFPGVLPRGWGNEFSRSELDSIHYTLSFVLTTASPQTASSLLFAFRGTNNTHWILCNYWPEIVPLLTKQNTN
ncbi:hypothetical protein [Spirosoma foliorum]|uniref:Uncharacterized protein n=1 Tax=Spirosoma foliorum TaxID=2710596 RepID=A0A7G5H0B8_9BACT|nr:hypothetical protein [Spirosoma foliorum]QMW04560.1 hypothetical protein H3H32_06390 [Spirosoma foliorum]